jgi:hypothetical protein
MSGAPRMIVLRAVRVYKSESPLEVYFRHVLHIHRSQGIPLSAGIRISWQISWRCGITTGWRAWLNDLPVGIARTWPLVGAFGQHLASLRVVGHSRRSRAGQPGCSPSVLHFPVPQRYGDCRLRVEAAAAGPGFFALRRVVVMREMRDDMVRSARWSVAFGRHRPGGWVC